jgi:hypothetical protein
MSSDLIVDLWRLITENIPQSIRALRAAPGFLKIDCLLNAPPGLYKLAPGESGHESEIVFPLKEQNRCCTENTVPRFARIDSVTDFTAVP